MSLSSPASAAMRSASRLWLAALHTRSSASSLVPDVASTYLRTSSGWVRTAPAAPVATTYSIRGSSFSRVYSNSCGRER